MFEVVVSFRMDEERPDLQAIECAAGRQSSRSGFGDTRHGPYRAEYVWTVETFDKAISIKKFLVGAFAPAFEDCDMKISVQEL